MRHIERTRGVHIPKGVVVKISLRIVGFETRISNNGMVVDNVAERIENVIRVLLRINVIIIAGRNSGLADNDIGSCLSEEQAKSQRDNW